MISFPNCKINLGLHVTGKRPDGYHNLETVFYPVWVKDALEIVRAENFNCKLSGMRVSGSADDNLCIKAYSLLKKDFPQIPAINIHLHKAIPMGAGLGGGSADAAFMLTMLNKKFCLNIGEEELKKYALQLGSDCAFFIINTPCFATGRGEKLQSVHVNLSDHKIVLISPGIHISTKEAFSRLTPTAPEKSILQIIEQPITTWKTDLKNDFEKSVFELYPQMEAFKNNLYNSGAVYASMTGSGSSIYGLFKADVPVELKFPGTKINVVAAQLQIKRPEI